VRIGAAERPSVRVTGSSSAPAAMLDPMAMGSSLSSTCDYRHQVQRTIAASPEAAKPSHMGRFRSTRSKSFSGCAPVAKPQLGTIYIGRIGVDTRVVKVSFDSPADARYQLQHVVTCEPFSCVLVLKVRGICGVSSMGHHDTGFLGTEIFRFSGTVEELVAELEQLCPPAPVRTPRPRPPVGSLVKRRGMRRARRVKEPIDSANDPQLPEYWPQGCLHSVPGGAVEPTERVPGVRADGTIIPLVSYEVGVLLADRIRRNLG
jgi:hypothetical protein